MINPKKCDLGNIENMSYVDGIRLETTSIIDRPDIEEVVLVDENNIVMGTMPKSDVHHSKTPLHRAFSVYIFNPHGKLLIQLRSHKKKTWPLIWSNSCCGHPRLYESNIDAAKRRIKYELDVDLDFIEEVADFRYIAKKDDIVENEICPVLVAFTSDKVSINLGEVETIKWLSWPEFLATLKREYDNFSPWCLKQSELLEKNNRFSELRKNIVLQMDKDNI